MSVVVVVVAPATVVAPAAVVPPAAAVVPPAEVVAPEAAVPPAAVLVGAAVVSTVVVDNVVVVISVQVGHVVGGSQFPSFPQRGFSVESNSYPLEKQVLVCKITFPKICPLSLPAPVT